MSQHLISPSILTADFLHLESEIEMVNQSEADLIHLDIMDGVFVPNLTFGFPVIKQIKKVARKPLDVHLMIVDPDRYLEAYRDAGALCYFAHLFQKICHDRMAAGGLHRPQGNHRCHHQAQCQ